MMLLEVKTLNVRYGVLQVLWDISLRIDQGEYVCIVGPNGAGKTTILKSIVGLVKPESGSVSLLGKELQDSKGYTICKHGISLISEELNLFTGMTVQENLNMGAFSLKSNDKKQRNLSFVYDLFPRLSERKHQLAGTMSGGERKMLAIARGIMSSPKLLMVDEPSLGLAPNLVNDVFTSLDVLRRQGMTILLVEQNVNRSFRVTDRGYVLEQGKIILDDISDNLANNPHVKEAYLGQRKSA